MSHEIDLGHTSVSVHPRVALLAGRRSSNGEGGQRDRVRDKDLERKMKTWVQLGEQIWRCLTGFHTSVAYCRHYYNVAFGHFYRWKHCRQVEGKQQADKKWLSWMTYRREAGSVWIKLQSYSRSPLFIFLSKWKWLPLVSSFKRKVWLTFIWMYVRMVSCAANNSALHFWQLTLDVVLFLKLAWIVKIDLDRGWNLLNVTFRQWPKQ